MFSSRCHEVVDLRMSAHEAKPQLREDPTWSIPVEEQPDVPARGECRRLIVEIVNLADRFAPGATASRRSCR